MSASATLAIKVIARASRSEVVDWQNDRLRLRIKAVPERGRANRAVEEFLAELLDLSRRQVRIISGHTASHKIVAVEGLAQAELYRRLPDRPQA